MRTIGLQVCQLCLDVRDRACSSFGLSLDCRLPATLGLRLPSAGQALLLRELVPCYIQVTDLHMALGASEPPATSETGCMKALDNAEDIAALHKIAWKHDDRWMDLNLAHLNAVPGESCMVPLCAWSCVDGNGEHHLHAQR